MRAWRVITRARARPACCPWRLRIELGQLDPQALNGSNDIEFGVFVNDEHGHVLLSAVFDNLGKGASGAAVQNLDLMLAALR